jgi:hypothetical protein
MLNSASHWLRRIALPILLGVIACGSLAPDTAAARTRQGDRFGIRGGIWPQSEVVGTFGTRRIYPGGDSLRTGIDEEARILPYVELYALFHLNGPWWAEGSLGWSGRNDVQVSGTGRADKILLGNGRVDFFPVFVGIRAVKPFGEGDRPHNVFVRGGGSVMFANESPDLVQDSVLKYGIYTSGTEAAFGFLAGAGAEYYVEPTVAFVADISYRYAKFSYGREAKFDLSAFWFGAGITLKTR